MFGWTRESGYADRREAGRVLAGLLARYRHERPIVLGLPRGGVAVAAEIAGALGAPLDVLVARKVGAPTQPELAIGAVAPGVQFFHPHYVRLLRLSARDQDRLAARARDEMDRRIRRFRGDGGLPDVKGRTVILVDDGVATGATALAGIRALRKADPKRIVVAVGVCPPETVAQLEEEADEVVCPLQPEPFEAVGLWFGQFDQVTDDEVVDLLNVARKEQAGPGTPSGGTV